MTASVEVTPRFRLSAPCDVPADGQKVTPEEGIANSGIKASLPEPNSVVAQVADFGVLNRLTLAQVPPTVDLARNLSLPNAQALLATRLREPMVRFPMAPVEPVTVLLAPRVIRAGEESANESAGSIVLCARALLTDAAAISKEIAIARKCDRFK